MTEEYEKFTDAWRHARALSRGYWRAQGAKDRAEWARELELLFKGEHPSHPGITISKTEFDLSHMPLTCDGAYNAIHHVPTRDNGIFFKCKGIDVAVNRVPTKDTKLPPEGVERIFDGLRDVLTRLIKLEGGPSTGPSIPAPRAMAPQEAYSAAQQAYLQNQAKHNQHRAALAMPTVYPDHPEFVAKEAKEQREAIQNDPRRSDTPAPTTDARAPYNNLIARNRGRLTFPGISARPKTKSTLDTEAAANRALRDREHTLMRDMVRVIDTHINKE
jgi:hypothetical protein